MGKGSLLKLAALAAIGGIAYTVNYMVKNDEFNDNTKDRYNDFVDSAKNVGKALQRTYVSLGDKDAFEKSTKNLSKVASILASDTGKLVKDSSGDMYNFFYKAYEKEMAKSKKSSSKKSPAKNKSKKK